MRDVIDWSDMVDETRVDTYKENLAQIRQLMSDKEQLEKLARLATLAAGAATDAAGALESPDADDKLQDLSSRLTSLLVAIDVMDYLQPEWFKLECARAWAQVLLWNAEIGL